MKPIRGVEAAEPLSKEERQRRIDAEFEATVSGRPSTAEADMEVEAPPADDDVMMTKQRNGITSLSHFVFFRTRIRIQITRIRIRPTRIPIRTMHIQIRIMLILIRIMHIPILNRSTPPSPLRQRKNPHLLSLSSLKLLLQTSKRKVQYLQLIFFFFFYLF